MSADLSTSITMRGTSEELLSMLKVLQLFETEKFQQYKKNKDCGYINDVKVQGAAGEIRTVGLKEQDLIDFLSNAGSELSVEAGGVWGVFDEPGEVGLFEALAEAAPNAFFDGDIEGYITGADVGHYGKLIDGKLQLMDCYVPDEMFPDLYMDEFKKKLPYLEFCELFKVEKEEFDSDCYDDFITEVYEEGFPTEFDYDAFMECCDCSEINEEQYKYALEKVAAIGIVDYETFRLAINEDDYARKSVYDPIAKKYKGRTLCKGLTFVVVGEMFEYNNREALSKYIVWRSGNVSESVSKNTDYLINNDVSSDSPENKKAKELGVEIITEAEFINMFRRI